MTLEQAFIEHCSPTLAGLKPASLFRYFPANLSQFAFQFQHWKEHFARLGLQLIVLKGCRRSSSYLLYLYRKQQLDYILAQSAHQDFLISLQYHIAQDSRDFLRQVAQRLCLQKDFPHEIGIF